MTKYKEVLRALLSYPYPEMEKMGANVRTKFPFLFDESQIHPCGLCGVVCKVAASYGTGDTMVQHRAPCGALCGRGLYHGDNPHFATSCPNCNPGSVEGDPGSNK